MADDVIKFEQRVLDNSYAAAKLETEKKPESGLGHLGLNAVEQKAKAEMRKKLLLDLDGMGDSPYAQRVDLKDPKGHVERLYISKQLRYEWDFENHDGAHIISWTSALGSQLVGQSPTSITQDGIRRDVALSRALNIERARVQGYEDFRNVDTGVLDQWEEVVSSRLEHQSGSSQVRDILDTLQRDQRNAVFMPWHPTLVVEGGPGTGKSQIGALRIIRSLSPDSGIHVVPEDVLWLVPSVAFRDYMSPMLQNMFGISRVHVLTSDQWFARQSGVALVDLPATDANRRPSRNTMDWLRWIDFGLQEWKNERMQQVSARMVHTWTLRDKRSNREVSVHVSEASVLKACLEVQDVAPDRWFQSVFAALDRELVARLWAGASVHSLSSERRERVQMIIREWLRQELTRFEKEPSWKPLDVYRSRLEAWDPTATMSRDDLACVAWLALKGGAENRLRARVLIVDEAQTISLVGYQALQLAYGDAAWTLVGDWDQQSVESSGVRSWVEAVGEDRRLQRHVLSTNYRSSEPIVRALNGLRRMWGGTPEAMKAMPYEAKPVTGYIVGDHESEVELVATWVGEQSGRSLLVVPTLDRVDVWCRAMEERSLKAVAITKDNEWPEGAIGVGTPDTVQGLECDAVWIVDADSGFYPMTSPDDFQLQPRLRMSVFGK